MYGKHKSNALIKLNNYIFVSTNLHLVDCGLKINK